MFSTHKFSKKNINMNHILILGNTQVEGYKVIIYFIVIFLQSQFNQTFLNELYHQDHGVSEFPSVILKSSPPDDDMMNLLAKNNLQTKLTYL